MNALTRLISLGVKDADRRIAAALQPRPLDPLDRYLSGSVIVGAIDRVTAVLSAAWLASRPRRISDSWLSRTPVEERGRAYGTVLLIAVLVHVTLTMIQGPRPGWFWLLIPAMVLAVATLLLAGVRSAPRL